MVKKTAESRISAARAISIIHRNSVIFLENELKKYNIGTGQLMILKALNCNDGINQESISDFLVTDKTTVTKNIKPLIKEGYISREKNNSDRRSYRICLTEKGKSIIPEIYRIIDEWTECLLAGFSAEDRSSVLKFLEVMTGNACLAARKRKDN